MSSKISKDLYSKMRLDLIKTKGNKMMYECASYVKSINLSLKSQIQCFKSIFKNNQRLFVT